jgi:hypothetical protein
MAVCAYETHIPLNDATVSPSLDFGAMANQLGEQCVCLPSRKEGSN